MSKCTTTIEWFNNLGFAQYNPCDRKAKYNLRYLEPCRKKETINRNVCGIHYNAFVKKAKRLNIDYKAIQLIKETI